MSDKSPAVVVLPYGMKLGFRPGQLPLDQMAWPLGQPDRLKGRALRELAPEDHLLIYPSGTAHIRPSFGTKAKVSMMVVEPTALHRKHLEKLKRSHRKFCRVLNANEDFLTAVPNGLFLPFGTTWVPEWREADVTKSRMLSLIASSKRDLKGHVLRHSTVEWAADNDIDMDVMGRGYRSFETKSDGLAPYRFSVVIENVQEPNYFTEKLLDAILCETVPIYWGCPNIGRFLNTDGMVICNSAEDLQAAIRNASEEEFERRLPALRAIKEKAAYWGNLEQRAAKAVIDSVGKL
ncbi:Glycosyltransferase family 10 (fucosyltransferase) C-term [Shimia gijangensis]|uniref:Glycosyltransferase family 10 (Fucosyltransferase) C-term n=1 Tax=Shimia gijangensis TaxID=1470563 RepID=A0A1M6CU47_9RHOB|nr:glycosyltransferase family 10 [Shimia gijangensis]SHI64605.1 Glycosyltransferase family 10 (fucosyltransferase) C-term [Shimia gijangensis]